jgi:serine/threonine protein kinase
MRLGVGSLEDFIIWLKSKGFRLSEEMVRVIMVGVLAGVKYMHQKGVVHRDLKPGVCSLFWNGFRMVFFFFFSILTKSLEYYFRLERIPARC